MKPKPLINQNALQKISIKSQNFTIRNKVPNATSTKPLHINNNPDHTDTDHALTTEIDCCVQMLELYLQHGRPLEQKDGQRVIKAFSQIKRKCSFLESSGNLEESDEHTLGRLRHSESKYKSKPKTEITERVDSQNSRGTVEMLKRGSSKIKLGKENNKNHPAFWEMKVEKLQIQLFENEKMKEESETKIRELTEQTNQINILKREHEEEVEKLVREKKDLNAKASSLVLQNMDASENKSKQMVEMESTISKMTAGIDTLGNQLKEREDQLVSLFQSCLL